MPNSKIPILKATTLLEPALRGGIHKPVVLQVENREGELRTWVVKVFGFDPNDPYRRTRREIYGSTFLQAFDLKTPPFGLVKVNQRLIDEIKETGQYVGFNLQSGIYFGSELIENFVQYIDPMGKDLNIETMLCVFAFDVLINNVDRSRKNLLICDDDILLIDHEKAFSVDVPVIFRADTQRWRHVAKSHAFAPYLRFRLQQKKNGLNFDLLHEYLRTLSVSSLVEAYEQINDELLMEADDFFLIREYVQSIRQQPSKFIDVVKTLLL